MTQSLSIKTVWLHTKASFGFIHSMCLTICIMAPLYVLNTGLITILFANFVACMIGLTTSWLILKHRGQSHSTVQQVIEYHFQKPNLIKKMFGLGVLILYFGTVLTYMNLGIVQLNGLIPQWSNFNPFIFTFCWNLAFLLITIFKIQESYISFGFTSAILFTIFYIWAMITAPQGNNQVQLIISFNMFKYMGIGLFAYANHCFFMNYLKQSKIPENQYAHNTFISFIGTMILSFLFCFAAYGLVNRQSRLQIPKTPQDFFAYGNWQVMFIQISYFLHLITAGPYLTIRCCVYYTKVLLNLRPQNNQFILDFFIYFLYSLIGLLINILEIPISKLVEVSGAFGGFLLVILVPIILHIKCQYLSQDSSTQLIQENNESQQKRQQKVNKNQCKNPHSYSISISNIFELIWLGLCLIVGVTTMIQIIL